jgi:glycerol-3-phosphate acyltransferase PlsY
MASNTDLGGVYPLLAIAAVAGYLLGSLPFGYWVARSRGVNIFEVGSKSPGATNVRRVLGKGPASAVLALDVLKGALAAGWPSLFALFCARSGPAGPVNPAFTGISPLPGYLGLAFALVGHSFSCFTRFRGGKGVATAAGGLSVLMPAIAAISAAIWVAVFFTTRYVSLASILAALALPVLAVLLGRGHLAEWVAAMIALFVLVRHRTNIGRLLCGTEKRFERRKPGEEPAP